MKLPKIKCKRCGAGDIAMFDEVKAQMPEYIKTIGEDMRVTDDEYKARLELCEECEGLAGGLMCKYCGCFVHMRALKKQMNCPSPLTKKW